LLCLARNFRFKRGPNPRFLEEECVIKTLWPPYSPDANPLNFWSHIEARACSICHPNIEAVKASIDEEWMAMDPDYIVKNCKVF